MAPFIFGLIFLAAAAALALTRNRAIVGPPHPRGFVLAGVGVALLGALLTLSSFVTVVSTKNVGVLTTFGKPDGYLQNGLHFKAPWQSVTELNDAIQTDTYATDANGAQQQGAAGTCVNVRIARQATACANVSIRWQIRPSGVDYLFRNFQGNAAIQDNLVLRDLQTAMNQSFETYDPLGIDANGMSTNEPLAQISADVQKTLTAELGQWVEVEAVNVPILNFPTSVQDKINQLQSQITATRVAQQSVFTAQAQAKANEVLAASVSHDPNVLTDKCLNILKEAVEKGQALPAGFSCFPGSNAAVAVR